MRLLEWPFGVVVVLVGLLYFARLDDLPLRGEESRRATVAMEMMETDDWVVPRQQGTVYFMSARPPLQAWLIAAAARGGWPDGVAVRLPSVLAILLTAALIYAYARTFLSPVGAFASAAGFVSMGQVLQLGRFGETDALFSLFVASSMPRGIEYFCVQQGRTVEGAAYEEIARINCYRKRESPLREYVRVCRFLR